MTGPDTEKEASPPEAKAPEAASPDGSAPGDGVGDSANPAMGVLRDFLVAASFWCWLPLPLDPAPRRAELGQSRYMFPLIGLLLGMLPAVGFTVAVWLHLTGVAAAIVALGILMILTGGRAEIATASMLEALFRSRNPDTRAKILSETRPGYYGMLGLILLVLAKLALLGSTVSIWHGVSAILAAAAVSRGVTAVATWFADGLDRDRIAGLELEAGRGLVWIPAVASVVLLILLLWFWSGLVAIPLVVAVTGLAFMGCRAAFGGLPVYAVGLLQQVAEVTILLAAVAHF